MFGGGGEGEEVLQQPVVSGSCGFRTADSSSRSDNRTTRDGATMVRQRFLQEARRILDEIQGAANVPIVVVPPAVALGDNPAVTIKKPLHRKMYRDQMTNAKPDNYDKDVNVDDLVQRIDLNSILVKDGILEEGTEALKRAVIWHEYGHVVGSAEETGDIYLNEVQRLTEAQDRLGPEDVRSVIDFRTDQYKKAVEPGKDRLENYLRDHWNINIRI